MSNERDGGNEVHNCDHDSDYCKKHIGSDRCNMKDAINLLKGEIDG